MFYVSDERSAARSLPPIFVNDFSAGAAARAAAAAQNELARAERDASKLHEQRLYLDSESGIGIDLPDGIISDAAVVRKGESLPIYILIAYTVYLIV